MGSKLIFLEFVDQAQDWLDYINNKGDLSSDFVVVSFHPKVKVFLQDKGIGCIESYELCDSSAHGKLLEVLQEWTDSIRKQLSLQDENGVKDAYIENLIFSARAALSVWLYRAHVCTAAIKHYKPKSVWVVEGESLEFVCSAVTERSERYLWDICTQFKDIVVEKISPSNPLPNVINKKTWLMMFMQQVISFINMRMVSFSGSKQIVALVNSHNMDLLLQDLSKRLGREFKFSFLSSRPRKTPVSIIWRDLINTKAPYRYLYFPLDKKVKESSTFLKAKYQLSKDFQQLTQGWKYENISPATWINCKYRKAFEETVINQSYFQSCSLTRLWSKQKPWLVLSQQARGLTAVAAEICRLKQIKSLMIPHGSFTPLRNPYAALEWRENALGMINTHFEYVAVQTPLTEAFLKDVAIQSKKIITGPLIIGRPIAVSNMQKELKNRLAPNGEKIILHASTPKHRQGQRFLNYETIDEYVQAMIDLVSAVDKLEGYKLILRFRPVDGLTSKELKALLPSSQSFCIASDGNFNDYLAIADLLVSFSSTTMEEALINNVAVLQYDKFNRYEHIPGILLKQGAPWPGVSGVYTVNTSKDLAYALGAIKTNHLNQSKSFLGKSYCYPKEKCLDLEQWIRNL